MEKIKVYVEVTARFTVDGEFLPIAFIWEDGRRYEIDRIVRCQRCASPKAGVAIIRYTCLVGGRMCHLYCENNLQWFVQRRIA